MNFIKKVLGDSKELVNKYIILSIIHLVYAFLVSTNYYYDMTGMISIGFVLGYFILIKTNFGKRNFNIINKVLSVLLLISAVFNGYNLITELYYGFIYGDDNLFYICNYLVSLLFSLYWIVVFLVPERHKMKLFKNKDVNEKIYKGLFITSVVCFAIMIFMYLKLVGGEYFEYAVIWIIDIILVCLEYILQLRYICLYQKFKESRR